MIVLIRVNGTTLQAKLAVVSDPESPSTDQGQVMCSVPSQIQLHCYSPELALSIDSGPVYEVLGVGGAAVPCTQWFN